jgi:hypothetical protein
MSLFNSFDRDTYLGEVALPRETQGQGVLTAAQQRALLQANLFGTALVFDGSGGVLAAGGGGIGYTTGAGGAVTQITSRTTGVTLNTLAGAITLFSAAGSATNASFTVTNSKVAATDTVVLVQKSGTDLYQLKVTNVAAGSFQVTFNTTGGTTTEQPVFNFAVIKGAIA